METKPETLAYDIPKAHDEMSKEEYNAAMAIGLEQAKQVRSLGRGFRCSNRGDNKRLRTAEMKYLFAVVNKIIGIYKLCIARDFQLKDKIQCRNSEVKNGLSLYRRVW